jgi:hypothetical protein
VVSKDFQCDTDFRPQQQPTNQHQRFQSSNTQYYYEQNDEDNQDSYIQNLQQSPKQQQRPQVPPHQQPPQSQPQQQFTVRQSSQTQMPVKQQNSYSYSQQQGVPTQQPPPQVEEYSSYTRHTNLPMDFAGNQPHHQQMLRVQGKPVQFGQNSQQNRQPVRPSWQQNTRQNNVSNVEEVGDFPRPGYNARNVQQPQRNQPPIVPPKPQGQREFDGYYHKARLVSFKIFLIFVCRKPFKKATRIPE